MSKQYVISIKSNLKTVEKTAVTKALAALNVNIVSQLDDLNTITVNVADENIVGHIKQIKGVLAVEDDSTMNIL
jgi:hypothetical protein